MSFNQNRTNSSFLINIGLVEPTEICSGLIKDEVVQAMSRIKNGKGCGLDKIPTEVLKRFADEALDQLIKVFSNLYETRKIPTEKLT